MRELKFRGKSKITDSQALVYGYGCYIDQNERQFIITDDPVPHSFIQVEKIDRFTNLHDKNKKEIYEGDIVKVDSTNAMPSFGENGTAVRVIEFRDGCWCFDAGRYDDGDWIRFGFWRASNEGKDQLKQIEVIGSIYKEIPYLTKKL